MKSILSILLVFIFTHTQAQFALVEDKDGYTNIRTKGAISAPVGGRISSGSLVYIQEEGKDWSNVDYKENASGYIHNSRLRKIANYQEMPLLRAAGDSIVFKNDSLRIVLREAPFMPRREQLTFTTTADARYLSAINKRPFWGTDGGVPTRQYKLITCYWRGRQVSVPDSMINDVFEPNLDLTHVWYDPHHQRWFIEAINSDGAGGYEVAWMFEQGAYKTRYALIAF